MNLRVLVQRVGWMLVLLLLCLAPWIGDWLQTGQTKNLTAQRQRIVEASDKLSDVLGHLVELNQRIDRYGHGLAAMEKEPVAVQEGFDPGPKQFEALSERIERLQHKLDERVVSTPQVETSPPRPEEAGKTFEYVDYRAASHETLWSMAKKFYGDGHLYPSILESNPGLGIFYKASKNKFKILQDRQEARRVTQQLTRLQANRRLYHYRVVAGDSWESIASRFYGKGEHTIFRLKEINRNATLAPGARVWVPLQGESKTLPEAGIIGRND